MECQLSNSKHRVHNVLIPWTYLYFKMLCNSRKFQGQLIEYQYYLVKPKVQYLIRHPYLWLVFIRLLLHTPYTLIRDNLVDLGGFGQWVQKRCLTDRERSIRQTSMCLFLLAENFSHWLFAHDETTKYLRAQCFIFRFCFWFE